MMKSHQMIAILSLVLSAGAVHAAAQFPAQARLFAGSTSANPTELNQEMTNQGIKEFKSLGKYGVEITYPVTNFLDAGVRYEKRSTTSLEVNPTANSNYQAELDQNSLMLIARVPFLKSQYVRLDAFGAIGGSNTTLKLKTASQDGEWSRKEGNDWYSSVRSSFGASVAAGYKNVYFVLEGGMDSNKVDNLKSSGNISSNVKSLDLSGSYFTVGIMFDGITATSK